ncbi:MAG: threonine--tRNA ligase [Candidatus Aenigmatarchaeota archaeon]
MKILLLDSDYLEYEPKKKAIVSAEEIEKKKYRIENCLVVFTSVEKRDEADISAIVANAVKEIVAVAKQVAQKKIVIYPWVHLSQTPASPGPALEVLKELESSLKSLDEYEVHRAPFGWYKAFDVKCKGHPLSELTREISASGAAKKEDAAENMSRALKKEKELRSSWYIMTPDGKMTAVDKFNFSDHANLKRFTDYEIKGTRETGGVMPPHIRLMRKLEIADFEPGSDPGNLRWYPNGELMKNILEDYINQVMTNYGAMKVETPIMYDYHHPALEKYLQRFPARQYTMNSDKRELFLRFSACFGQYLIKHDASLSYRNLPLRMYELTHYSFRREQSGELAGLRRLRTFTMPDMHTLVKDTDEAKREFLNQYRLCMSWMKEINVPYEAGFRFVKPFFDENKDYIASLVKEFGRPVLIQIWDRQFFYFVMKFEFNFMDATGKAAALSTVQIDVENAERFDIKFTDDDNKRKVPLMLHASIPGAIERNIYAILEQSAMDQKEKRTNPVFPLWLSPTQIRLCPVNDSFTPYCEKLLNQLETANMRIDIDDRTESVQKKVRDAEMEWIPLIVVVGEKEKMSNKLAVRFRETSQVKQMPADEIIKYVKERVVGKPFRPLTMPKLLTKRPIFVG